MKEERSKSYTLRSHDTALLDFSLYLEEAMIAHASYTKYRIEIDKLYSEQEALLPMVLKIGSPLTGERLFHWIQCRKVPRNRRFSESIRASLDGGRFLGYVDVTRALSLNDAYWITAADDSTSWADCNLYDNPFDDRLTRIAFTGVGGSVSGMIATPEITTCGRLRKCWIRKGGDIYLRKGVDFMPSPEGLNQAVLEWYAAQVAAVMAFSHAFYELETYTHSDGTRETVCLGKLFTSADVGYVDAYTYFSYKGLDRNAFQTYSLEVQNAMAELYGRCEYADMMIFDSLICNKDRHYGNFGYLYDTRTGRLLQPAPLFDNGCSLLYDANSYELEHIDEYLRTSGRQGVSMPFDILAQFFVEPRHLEGLRKLTAFSFENHPTCPLPEKTLARLTNFVRLRAQRIIDLYEAREKYHRLTVTD